MTVKCGNGTKLIKQTVLEQDLIRHNNKSQSEEEDSSSEIKQHDDYEVIDLIDYYLTPIHKFIYQISLSLLMFVGLLAHSQVFCGSILALLFWDKAVPGLPQIIFGTLVLPLSCMKLNEQVSLQPLMAIIRFVATFFMVAGSIFAPFIDNNNSSERSIQNNPPYWASSAQQQQQDDGNSSCYMSYTVYYSNFGIAFLTALFSQLFQHLVPGLLRPLKEQEQHFVREAPKVFGASLLTTCSFYLPL